MNTKKRRLAIVDPTCNAGGGSRVLRAFLPALKTLAPDLKLVFFCNMKSLVQDGVAAELQSHGIQLENIKATSVGHSGNSLFSRGISHLRREFLTHFEKLPPLLSGNIRAELEAKLIGFDAIFYFWPYFFEPPRVSIRAAACFHDFNFHYYFSGVPTFSRKMDADLRRQMNSWVESQVIPVCSSAFMLSELKKFYPGAAERSQLIRWASNSTVNSISPEQAQMVVARILPLGKKYVLYPTNLCSHKNIGNLIHAIYLLEQEGEDLILVLTGPETDRIQGRANSRGVELHALNPNVIGLGYVSNIEMDSLIRQASVVISTSLYEAGNGPAADAWNSGSPVAMSNTSEFLENLEVFGTRAEVFDPHSPHEIALAIRRIIHDTKLRQEMVEKSKAAIQLSKWEDSAKSYLFLLLGS